MGPGRWGALCTGPRSRPKGLAAGAGRGPDLSAGARGRRCHSAPQGRGKASEGARPRTLISPPHLSGAQAWLYPWGKQPVLGVPTPRYQTCSKPRSGHEPEASTPRIYFSEPHSRPAPEPVLGPCFKPGQLRDLFSRLEGEGSTEEREAGTGVMASCWLVLHAARVQGGAGAGDVILGGGFFMHPGELGVHCGPPPSQRSRRKKAAASPRARERRGGLPLGGLRLFARGPGVVREVCVTTSVSA